MKRLLLVLAVTGGISLIVFVMSRSTVDSMGEGSNPASAVGVVLIRDFPSPSGVPNHITTEIFQYATEAHRKEMESRESEKHKLIEVIQHALRSGDPVRWERVCQNQLRLLIQCDPLAAARLALGLDSGPIRAQILREIAQEWAAQDTTAALAWANRLTDAGERNSALANVCVDLSQSNPAEAIDTAKEYGLVDEGGLYENMVEQWAAKDAPAALDWVAQLPAGAERDEMMMRVAFAEAQISPKDAANLVVQEISAGPAQDEAAMSVLHQWGLQDFAGASAWVDQFPAGSLRERATQELSGIAKYRQSLND